MARLAAHLGKVGMYKTARQCICGWSSLEMAQRYAHLAPEHLAEYANNAKVAKSLQAKNEVKLKLVK
ncbi:hypothetical protein [Methylotuvimicrobium sp. KM2]|uniref:hypothetical protein n=1 Tax=Methylotuvimicrobium sp. KM2 TaxID=3133976 RepID=UPI003100FDD3